MVKPGLAIFILLPLVFALRPLDENHQNGRVGGLLDPPLLPLDLKAFPTQIAVNTGSSFALLGVVHKSKQAASKEMVSVSAHNEVTAVKRIGDVDMKPRYLDLLFNLIDIDGKDGISQEEWQKEVVGEWADDMWKAMDVDNDGRIEDGEFDKQWDTAVDVAFDIMGGEKDNKIKADDVDKWTATPYEKEFVKDKFLADGVMDGEEFEEFMYTVMMFRSMNPDGDADVSWNEVLKNPVALAAFGGPNEEAKFHKKFGADGMQIGELYDFLNELKVFIRKDGSSAPDNGSAATKNEEAAAGGNRPGPAPAAPTDTSPAKAPAPAAPAPALA